MIGQVGFHFQLSIAQILISLATCAVLEVAIAFRTQHVLMWPASALLTGNGVAFILRVPGHEHGDWWSLRGWWIFAGTAAVSLLSKYVIKWRGNHIFNPSNIGLVLCFLILGRGRADPLDFWWGPMSPWLVLALVVILAGGFVILSRLKLLWIAVAFWLTFAAAIGVIALTGHAMTRALAPRPDHGLQLLVGAGDLARGARLPLLHDHRPEDGAEGRTARASSTASSLGLLGALLIAPTTTEFASKVAPARLARDRLHRDAAAAAATARAWRRPRGSRSRRRRGVAIYVGALVRRHHRRVVVAPAPPHRPARPAITILPSRGVQTQLNLATAQLIAHGLVKAVPRACRRRRARLARARRRSRPAGRRGAARRRDLPAPPDAGGHWVLGRTPAARSLRARSSERRCRAGTG